MFSHPRNLISGQGLRRLFTTAVCLSGCLAATSDAGMNPVREVRAPHYGEVLFDFYQQKYFSSITRLLVAERQERVTAHSADAELLRGGMFLSYGLHDEATRIFTRLIDQGATPQVRDRAWFFLAKIRQQRGYIDEAEEALAHIQDALPDALQEERLVLSAYLLMAREKYTDAITVLRTVKGRTGFAAYGRYNLGVALIKSGATDAGIGLLGEVGYMPAADDEMKALRDKANLALGYYFLQQGVPSIAKAYLNEVRIDSPQSNMALLGAGWGYTAEEKHEQALVPWLELQQRNVIDPAVQESLLAVPYAYGKLGAYKQALTGYQHAISSYENELQRLDDSIGAIRAGRLTNQILQLDPDSEMGWFWEMRRLPDSAEGRYLAHLLAGHEFQEALKNLRDLHYLLNNLESWSGNIGVFNTMLVARRAAYDKQLPGVIRTLARLDLGPVTAARDKYAAELDRIEADNDHVALADNNQKEQVARLARVRSRLHMLAGQEDVSEAMEKYRLLGGLMIWNLSDESIPRLWQTRKSLRALDQAIVETRQRRQSLTEAKTRALHSFDGFDTRITAFHDRIAALQTRLHAVASVQQRYLEALAVDDLVRQKERIGVYLVQARFAVAQIYDQAARAGTQEK